MADGRSKVAFIVIIYLISRDPLLIFNNLARKGRVAAIWIIRRAASANHLGEYRIRNQIILFLMTDGKMSINRLYILLATKVIFLIIVLFYKMGLIT